MSVELAHSVLLALTAFMVVAGFLAAAGRYRDAKLLALLAEEERRLERCADRVWELVQAAGRPAADAAFERAQVGLAEAQASLARNVPHCRRLLLFGPEEGERLADEARLALEELGDLALETRLERDLYTLGFAWARKRRRELDERIGAREREHLFTAA